ncbi:MAG: hypothetical protein Q7R45_14255 [Sulfuricaulis sp.]|nr:hypothetical protein [Sulfuricaulis sp.]
MKRKPFDLEAAKRGEPIGFQFTSHIEERRFIGMHSDGAVVYEAVSGDLLQTDPDNISMLPRKVVKYGLMHVDRRGKEIHTSLFESADRFSTIDPEYRLVRVEWEE